MQPTPLQPVQSGCKTVSPIPARSQPRLEPGMLVAFSISVERTAALLRDTLHTTDALKTKLKACRPRKYLGIVRTSHVRNGSERRGTASGISASPPPETTVITYVGDHRPDPTMYYPDLDSWVDVASFCIPIETMPTLIPSGTSERAPLQLAPHPRAFPFPGSFAHTNFRKPMTVEWIHEAEGRQAWRLSASGFKEYTKCLGHDDTAVQDAFDRMADHYDECLLDEDTQVEDEDIIGDSSDQISSPTDSAGTGIPFEAGATRRNVLPPYDIRYDVWLDLEDPDIALDPAGCKAEDRKVRGVIEEALVQAVANTSPNVPKVRSSFELDSVERVQENDAKKIPRYTDIFKRELGMGMLLGLGLGTLGGVLLTRSRVH